MVVRLPYKYGEKTFPPSYFSGLKYGLLLSAMISMLEEGIYEKRGLFPSALKGSSWME